MFFSFLIEIISKFFGLFGYISNDRLYPEPLSKTEEEYYLRKYFDGDKEARKILIEHNSRPHELMIDLRCIFLFN